MAKKMTSRFFSKGFLVDLTWDEDSYVVHEIWGRRRWDVIYRAVFEHESKFYETTYQVGATEVQDERPYEYEDDEISCKEVFPVKKEVVVYE